MEDNLALLLCLIYIDLNPVRAGLADQAEQYLWCTIGQLTQSQKTSDFISLELGSDLLNQRSFLERKNLYQELIQEICLMAKTAEEEPLKTFLSLKNNLGLVSGSVPRLLTRNRYFSDATILGSKEFVLRTFSQFKENFAYKGEKKATAVKGFKSIYSLRRLTKM